MIDHPAADGLAIVTGAAGSIGQATTRRLAALGYEVLAFDMDPGLGALVGDVDGVRIVTGDLTTDGVDKVRRAISASDKAPVVLVNNAGILSNNKLAETDLGEWRRVMTVNLDAAFLLSQAIIGAMRAKRFGRIINVCSLAMKTGGLTAGTAYSVSKGALGALTFSIARETAGDGITANGIAPAYVESPMVFEQLTEDERSTLLEGIPVGRFCKPDEIAYAIEFLVSPLAGFITGEILDINGGLHLD